MYIATLCMYVRTYNVCNSMYMYIHMYVVNCDIIHSIKTSVFTNQDIQVLFMYSYLCNTYVCMYISDISLHSMGNHIKTEGTIHTLSGKSIRTSHTET